MLTPSEQRIVNFLQEEQMRRLDEVQRWAKFFNTVGIESSIGLKMHDFPTAVELVTPGLNDAFNQFEWLQLETLSVQDLKSKLAGRYMPPFTGIVNKDFTVYGFAMDPKSHHFFFVADNYNGYSGSWYGIGGDSDLGWSEDLPERYREHSIGKGYRYGSEMNVVRHVNDARRKVHGTDAM